MALFCYSILCYCIENIHELNAIFRPYLGLENLSGETQSLLIDKLQIASEILSGILQNKNNMVPPDMIHEPLDSVSGLQSIGR